jgi:hypothetical protein
MAEEANATATMTNVAVAEGSAETQTPDVDTNADADASAPKVEDLMSELAQLKADMARNKNALDKALREKGEITKRLREKQTAEEAEAEAKAEAEAARAEREAEMERKIATYEAKSMFTEMGLVGKDLETAVQAKIDGDEKTVYSVIVKYFENKYESALKTKESEWLGNRPQVNVGVGENGTALTKEQFSNMSYKERMELKSKDIETYNKFSN